jgi:hypothetical protein
MKEVIIMANINVLDRRATNVATEEDVQRLGSPGDRTLVVDQSWSIHRICDRVRMYGTRGVLRIVCHGNASFIQLGSGMWSPGDTTDFQLLRGSFVGAYPRIEIHACGVANARELSCSTMVMGDMQITTCDIGIREPNAPGMQLLQAIADNAGVLVMGALDVQRIAPGFEGSIVYCRPAVPYAGNALIGR